MSRRLSGSAEETDNTEPTEAEPPPYRSSGSHGKKRSFTSAKYDVTRHSDTLDRRKVDKAINLTQLSANGSNQPAESTARPGATKKQTVLEPGQDFDTMSQPRGWRRSRAHSPWSSSLLTIFISALAGLILFSIVHAFLTRHLDPKGCDMCWSRPIYIKFSDFDTEHTRFASKYHLHLLREGGFDEDPKVRAHLKLAYSPS